MFRCGRQQHAAGRRAGDAWPCWKIRAFLLLIDRGTLYSIRWQHAEDELFRPSWPHAGSLVYLQEIDGVNLASVQISSTSSGPSIRMFPPKTSTAEKFFIWTENVTNPFVELLVTNGDPSESYRFYVALLDQHFDSFGGVEIDLEVRNIKPKLLPKSTADREQIDRCCVQAAKGMPKTTTTTAPAPPATTEMRIPWINEDLVKCPHRCFPEIDSKRPFCFKPIEAGTSILILCPFGSEGYVPLTCDEGGKWTTDSPDTS